MKIGDLSSVETGLLGWMRLRARKRNPARETLHSKSAKWPRKSGSRCFVAPPPQPIEIPLPGPSELCSLAEIHPVVFAEPLDWTPSFAFQAISRLDRRKVKHTPVPQPETVTPGYTVMEGREEFIVLASTPTTLRVAVSGLRDRLVAERMALALNTAYMDGFEDGKRSLQRIA